MSARMSLLRAVLTAAQPSGPSSGEAGWLGRSTTDGPVDHTKASATAAAAAALRDLDLGLMLGGPRFRRLLHAYMAWSEQQGVAAKVTAAAAAGGGGGGGQGGAVSEAFSPGNGAGAAKRRRRVHCAEPEVAVSAAAAAAMLPPTAAAEMAGTAHQAATKQGVVGDTQATESCRLPPGSLQTRPGISARLRHLHLPSLEEFATQCMRQGQHGLPAVITGVCCCCCDSQFSTPAWPLQLHLPGRAMRVV
jgi:hypothetical protein